MEMDAFHPGIERLRQEEARGVPGHTELYGKFEASLCHMSPCLKKKENRNKNYRKFVAL